MLTLNAFASLAQFGAGLALALAFFLEPINLRAKRFRTKLDESFNMTPNDKSARAQERRSEIWQQVIKLNRETKSAVKKSRIPVWLIQLGALINFVVLLACTIWPNQNVDFYRTTILLAAMIGPILAGAAWLLCIAHFSISEPS